MQSQFNLRRLPVAGPVLYQVKEVGNPFENGKAAGREQFPSPRVTRFVLGVYDALLLASEPPLSLAGIGH